MPRKKTIDRLDQISLRLSEHERRTWMIAAAVAGMSLSAWIRAQCSPVAAKFEVRERAA
jgi:hypothetical protein